MTNQYPLDFNSLVKGQFLSAASIEEILGVKSSSDKFRFAILHLQSMIQTKTGFTVKASDEGLAILTDPEAAEHNERLTRQYRRGLRTRYDLASKIDVAALSREQRERHDRDMLRNGRVLQAITREIVSLSLSGKQANTDRPNNLASGANGNGSGSEK